VILKNYYFAIIILLTTLSSCSQGTLKFFFDGTEKKAQGEFGKSVSDSLGILNPDTSAAGNRMMENIKAQTISVHPAYRDKLCEKCHDVNNAYRLINRQPDICFNCHQSFNKKYAVLHGPVAAGFCTACHKPHQSENKKLLVLPVREICQYCHQPGDVEKNKAHEKISPDECRICHNAHGGSTKNLLK
jgi:predicted CXXCH cytochrome family protein